MTFPKQDPLLFACQDLRQWPVSAGSETRFVPARAALVVTG